MKSFIESFFEEFLKQEKVIRILSDEVVEKCEKYKESAIQKANHIVKTYEIYYDNLYGRFVKVYDKSNPEFWLVSGYCEYISDATTTISRCRVPIEHINLHFELIDTFEKLEEVGYLYSGDPYLIRDLYIPHYAYITQRSEEESDDGHRKYVHIPFASYCVGYEEARF